MAVKMRGLVMKSAVNVVVLAAAWAALGAPGAFAELNSTPREETWVTNGTVNAIATTPSTTYIGGNFTYVGPNTGSFAALDAGTGVPALPYAKVNGAVNACAPDGAGGWYIGGGFSQVGTATRNNIAHILPNGTVDPAWNPNAGGTVLALAVSGATVYAGGSFTSIGGQTRNYIAALDAATGTATAWNPNAITTITALAVSGTTVYAGGYFTTIGGQTRNRIAALDATTGLATAWNPNASAAVNALAVSGSAVYAGGQFTTIGGQTRNRIAALDATTGLATACNPNANGTLNALAVSGTTVYAGGNFTTIGGQTRNYIAALDAATGTATTWIANASSTVYSLLVSGTTVYAGGGFTSIGGQTRNRIAALDAATGAATAWNPNASDRVFCLAVSGTTVYAGGDFASIGGQTRNRIAALDAGTGLATAWDPNVSGGSVWTMAASGTTVYVGGFFTGIGGQTRSRIAALDAATGTVRAWNPNANNVVLAVAAVEDRVYVCGEFTSIGGQSRSRIAALDAGTGLASTWNPSSNGGVSSLAVFGETIYAGGVFTYIGGQTRRCIAALDAGSGLATTWNPNADNEALALGVSGGTMYTGGNFGSIGGQTRNRIAAINTAIDTNNATAWDPNANGRVWALALSGGTAYIGGEFTTIGGQNRPYFAQFDTPLPTAPTNPGTTAIGADTIAWTWQDNSADETGFKVYDDPGAGPPATLRTTTAADATSWAHGGLTPNTQYAFQVAATNANGDSALTPNHARYTLAGPPSAGNNVVCDRSTGTAYPAGTVFSFSNPAGFGAGTHGGSAYRVSKFKYAWDTDTTYVFTGTEPDWSGGTLPQSPATSGSYYLHVQSFNAEDIANAATLDYGPFVLDADAPLAAAGDTPNVDQGSNPAQYDFTILYIDETAMQVSTMDSADIRVTGPNGFAALATFVSSNPGTNADLETAAYRITPPGGAWDLADEGVYTISLEAGQVTDAAGNPAAGGELGGFLVDFAPTATLASAAPAAVNGPVAVTVTLSEASADFASGDVQCANSAVANFAGSGTAYTFDLVPSGEGAFSCFVPAGRFTDTDGFGAANLESNTISRMCDLTPPTAVITMLTPPVTGLDNVRYEVVFSEPVTPSSLDIILTGSLSGGVAYLVGPPRRITIAPMPSDADGTVSFTIGAGVTDLAGNAYVGDSSPVCTIANWHGVLTQPQPVRGYSGGAATLTVAPDCAGGSAITYQWKHDDGLGKTIHDGPAASEWALALVPSVAGEYWCEMTYDGATYESDHVAVDVAVHLAITQQPQGGVKGAGESHTFSVTTTGGFAPLAYVWKQDDATVTGATGATLTLSPLTADDAGTYTVEVSDSYTDIQVSAQAELTVNAADTLPATGSIGLGLLVLGVIAAGLFVARAARNRRRAISTLSDESEWR